MNQQNPLLFPDLPSQPARKKRAAGPRRLRRAVPVLGLAARLRLNARSLSRRIKGGLTSRLARLDPVKLKRVLIACGVAAAVAGAVVLLAKLMPLIIALLTLLGVGAVVHLWGRLRQYHPEGTR